MKTKILLFVISFVFSFNLFAGNVTLQQAKKVALNFYFEKYNLFEGQVLYDQLAIQSVHIETDGIQNFYYIFHVNKGGFVIVSAEDCLSPVLGYSFNHEFVSENQPPNVQWWIQQYEGQVGYARKNKINPEKDIAGQWAYYLNDDFGSIKAGTNSKAIEPLLTTLWDQGWPYNCMCPSGTGGQAITGCVATGYAQCLYYWRFPLHGSGFHSYNHPVYGELSADFENTWYRWDEMCDAPQTNNTAIGELMFHLGVALEMNYGVNSSGAYGYPDQIEPYFNISLDYDSVRRDLYTDPEWRSMIIEQLDQAYPVPYIGFTSNMSSGHFWVCDGYQDTTYYHMNWGWGGSSNGYYTLDNLQGFTTSQFIGVNFYPDTINYTYPNYETGADTLVMFEGSITDGSGPIHNYLNNTQASWVIDPQTEEDSVTNITITMKRFDLYNDGDRLSIYDGGDNSTPLLAELTGNSIPDPIVSTGNKVFIEFITDGQNTAPGFYLNFFCEQPEWCSGMTQLTAPSTTFEDGSGSFYYYNSTTCTWIIDPGITDPLTLHFNCFDTEEDNDIFKIYDGVSQELIAEISGFYEEPPDPVTSPSGKMFLAFLSNNSVQADGWEAWYDINTGLSENTRDFNFQIIPNPVTSDVQISFNLQSEEKVTIQVFDIVGQKLEYLMKKTLTPGHHSIHGNLGHLHEGIYFFRLKAGNKVVTKKIIKVK